MPMAVRLQGRPPLRRAILIYLLTIVGPTLVLLYLGMQSVLRQREAVASLTVSNLRLSGERLAAEIERRAEQLAGACLRDNALTRLRLAAGEVDAPGIARQDRTLLASVRTRHRIARHFFVLQGTNVRFPLLRTPPQLPLEAYIARQQEGDGKRFAMLFYEGEDQELTKQHPDLALAAYRQCYGLPVSNSLKALALARVARCLQKLSRRSEALQTYGTISERYGDLYDAFHRPYAVTAALEAYDLAGTDGPSSPVSLAGIYRNLIDGRWELSVEQMDYYLPQLTERLKGPPPPQTEYLGHLKLARALPEGFRHHGPLQSGQVYDAVIQGDLPYQMFYTPLPLGQQQETLVGFAVDLNWVESDLLPRCRRDLGMAEDFGVALKAQKVGDTQANPQMTRLSFQKFFPFWELSAAPATGDTGLSGGRGELLAVAGFTVMVLAVLVLGVFFLMRDVSREMQLGQLRADFVSGVSHELKTPLTLIRLYGETLLYGEDAPVEERRNYYQIITRESERLTQLIERVLDFSRIDRGQKKYDLQEGDLAPVIASTVAVYGQYLERQGFSVESDIAAVVASVRFDADAISEAVLNLMDNAAKYSGESRVLAIRLTSNKEHVTFEVEDHGVGIAAGDRERIFQQFHRGRGQTDKGGHGLGLFLVKHIMDAHGGTVELGTEAEPGTRFRLIFPVSALSPSPQ